MQPLYTTLKVNNEIELCEVSDPDCKQLIERALLKNRISYYIRWPKASFFSRKKMPASSASTTMSRMLRKRSSAGSVTNPDTMCALF